ncbi:MAG TPA: beta-hydroxyacyl-ACP dehydratase, partial [Candidatus Paceibacterota bacterium]|nr:beta-hydroxyacyl-ACP dehydratase [Candidatus Paceibacterota bacterium]
ELAMRSLPHGPEFRFVDRLLQLTPGKTGVGEYTVRGDEHFFAGQPPEEATMPGVLMAEAAAQVAGLVVQEDPANPRWPRLKLAALRAVNILGVVRPGNTLRIEANIIAVLGDIIQARASASVAGVEVFATEVTLSGVESVKTA